MSNIVRDQGTDVNGSGHLPLESETPAGDAERDRIARHENEVVGWIGKMRMVIQHVDRTESPADVPGHVRGTVKAFSRVARDD